MRYFKTESTIFELVEEREHVYIVKAKNDPTKTYSKSKIQTNIIQWADDLIDLVNRIVTIYKGCHYQIYTKHQFGKKTVKEVKAMLDKGAKIYGAIWTKTGLSYATEINQELELVLL